MFCRKTCLPPSSSLTIKSSTDCRRPYSPNRSDAVGSLPSQLRPRDKRRIEAAVVHLTPGKLNAVRAAFKAGVKPSQIARQFGLSQSDVRKALASDASKGAPETRRRPLPDAGSRGSAPTAIAWALPPSPDVTAPGRVRRWPWGRQSAYAGRSVRWRRHSEMTANLLTGNGPNFRDFSERPLIDHANQSDF